MKCLMKDRSWVNDKYPDLHPLCVLGLFILYFVGTDGMDALGVALTEYLNPALQGNDEAIINYLNQEPTPFLLARLAWAALYLGICWLMGARFFGPAKEPRSYIKWILLGLGIEVSLQVADFLVSNYGHAIGISANQAMQNVVIERASLWRLLLSMALVPAVIEEVAMRGLLLRYGFTAYPLLGIFVSSLFFGAIHYTTTPVHALLYTLSGVGFGYTYYKTGRLESTITTHFLINSAVIIYFKYFAIN